MVDEWLGSRSVGAFRLCEPIGSGSQATVWLARWWADGRELGPVAVKVYEDPGAGPGDEAALEALRALSHPHVVRIHWVGRHAGKLCVAMEHAEGASLAGLLLAYPSGIPARELAGVLLDVADGLTGLHTPGHAGGAGMPHGDLKPGNVLICDGRAKLSDIQPRLATLAYAAPERLGSELAGPSPASDMYALGVMAWELLTGGLPCEGTVEEVRDAHLHRSLEPPGHLSAGWRELLAGCLRKDPEQRWTVRRVREALEALAAPEGRGGPFTAGVGQGQSDPGEARDTAWHPPPAPEVPGRQADPRPGDECIMAGVAFCYVPGGVFWTEADPDAEAEGDATAGGSPRDRLELGVTRGLWVMKTPVTNALWERVMGRRPPSRFEGDDRPVERATWFDAIDFCNALSRMAGLEPAYQVQGRQVDWRGPAGAGIRLATEAEWELAARGTAAGMASRASALAAWFGGRGATSPVGRLAANAWGLRDMLGNVWEWVWDWHDRRPAGQAAPDAAGPPEGTRRVCKGGSWRSSAALVRPAARDRNRPDDGRDFLGFRVVLTHVPDRAGRSAGAWEARVAEAAPAYRVGNP